ncbi:MAG: Proline dehydrogenase [Acidobacteriota bacterium]|nr:Proline dehydrogenase [Acidobacteriota bacterium]
MGILSWLIVKGLPLVPRAIVGRVASRYVAGEKLEDALAVVERLSAEGAMATLDLLGEEVAERSKATAAADEYVRMLDAIAARGLPANVSIKLTSLGLKIDTEFCRENAERIVAAAAGHGNFVRIDMEDHTTTDRTLAIYREIFTRHQNVGVVFQAYMRRTLADIAALPAAGANVRLCKGIYIEPRAVAWKGYETVRMNFLRALEKLLAAGVYVGIATHDEHLACGAVALVDRLQVPRERYEFQMLHGVDPELRQILIAGGHRLRVYVPYGRDWYPYSTRRLRENPEVATHILKGMFGAR